MRSLSNMIVRWKTSAHRVLLVEDGPEGEVPGRVRYTLWLDFNETITHIWRHSYRATGRQGATSSSCAWRESEGKALTKTTGAVMRAAKVFLANEARD
jgi:hypothetical protein